MDGGCEYGGYASDLTRTWPVNGKFTEPQKELYEIVLDVQKVCLHVRGTVFSTIFRNRYVENFYNFSI